MATYDPLGLDPDSAPLVALPGEPLTDVHRIAAEHALFRLSQGVTVETVTTDYAGRETVQSKQLPPNMAAAQAIAAALAPDRWASGGQGQHGSQVINVILDGGSAAQLRASLADRIRNELPALTVLDK